MASFLIASKGTASLKPPFWTQLTQKVVVFEKAAKASSNKRESLSRAFKRAGRTHSAGQYLLIYTRFWNTFVNIISLTSGGANLSPLSAIPESPLSLSFAVTPEKACSALVFDISMLTPSFRDGAVAEARVSENETEAQSVMLRLAGVSIISVSFGEAAIFSWF